MIPPRVRLFTIVFGDLYLDWFEKACFRSLSWPRNKKAIQERVHVWDIWSSNDYAERAVAIAKRMGILVNLHAGMRNDTQGNNLFNALIGQMGKCADKEEAFIFAAPDNIFGDGSVETLLEVGSVPGICVAVPTLRVAAEGFVEAMGDRPLANAELVKFAFDRLHPSFLEGDVKLVRNNGWVSGVTWRQIGPGLYAVTHRMPSSYLMQPTVRDVKWLRDRPKFGCYDHQFPQILVQQQRQRVIGSSDAAFMVELTTAQAHVPGTQFTDPREPDKYRGALEHHTVNRNTVCIWRAA